MDHTNDPKPQGPSGSESPPLEARLLVLEQRLAEQQDQLRDYEKSLVERIADVDDDRRTTASKLQRAWQTQREEIDDVLRRQTRTTLVVLFVFTLLLVVALFFAYREVQNSRQPLVDDMAQVKQEIARLSGFAVQGDPLQEELSRLSAAVGEISSSIGRADEDQVNGLQAALGEEQLNRRNEEARLDSEIQRLQAEQKRLVEEIASIRENLEAFDVEAEASGPETVGPAPSLETAPTQEAAPTIAEPPAEETPAAAEQPDAEDAAPAADVDEGPTAGESSGDADAESIEVGDQRYALQLIGFFSRDALLKFVRREDLPARVYYREDTYRGRPWFALIHSLYGNFAEAEEELPRLSPDLIALDPWIRPLRQGEDLKVLETRAER